MAARLIAALILLAGLCPLEPAAAQTFRDEYQTRSLPDLTGRTVRMPETVGGGPCEDTARHDSYYGSKPVRVVIERMNVPEPDVISGLIFYARCAVDICAIRETMLCWPRRDVFNTRPDLFEPDQPSRLITFDEPTGEPPRADRFDTGDARRPQQQSRVPNIPRRDDSREPGDCVDVAAPGVLAALADVRRRLQIAQARANATQDRFVSEAVRVLTGHVTWLAQPHGKPSEDVWRGLTQAPGNVWGALVAYLTNDNAANHRALREGAQRAIAALQGDPRGAAGWLTGQIALGGITGAGPSPGRCPGSVGTARITRAAAKADAAARRIGAVAENGAAFEGVNFRCGASPHDRPLGALRFHAERRRTNPKFHKDSCVGTTLADHFQKEGLPVTLEDVLPADWRGRGLEPWEVRRLFARVAEGGPTPNGMIPPELVNRDAGNALPHVGKSSVDSELRRAGPGSRVAVVVKLKREYWSHNNDIAGHVFTGEQHPGIGSVYLDAETGLDAEHWFDKALSVGTFRLK